MTTLISASIGFPSIAPVEGHFASLAILIDLGFLGGDGDYVRALEKAGFVIVRTGRRVGLDVSTQPRGVFSNGVGADALTLVAALASEGFEGVLRDGASGLSWYLSGGRCVSIFADERLSA